MSSPEVSPAPSSVAGAELHLLPRTLARRHVTLISLGGVIGAGLFVGSSVAIAGAGPAIVFSYLAAGILLLFIMRMLGELALARPELRAFTDFIRAGLGHGVGFVVGWTYWYLWTVVIAIESIAGATLLRPWIALPVWAMALMLIAIMWAINVVSTRTFAEFEFWFASIKVVAIVAFIVVAAAFAVGLSADRSGGLPGLRNGLMPYGSRAVIAGIATVFFSLTGAETATIAAAESKETARSIARLAGGLIARVAVFYILSVLLIVVIVPWRDIVPGVSPFSVTLQHLGLTRAADATSVIILTAVLSCLNSALYVSSRTLFALAAHADAGRWLTRLNARSTPARAVTFSTLVGTLGVGLAAVSPTGAFAFLVNTSGAIVLGVYLAVCAAYLAIRRSNPSNSAWQLGPYPVIVYLTAAGLLLVLADMGASKDMATQLYASLLPIIVASVAYAFLRRRRELEATANTEMP